MAKKKSRATSKKKTKKKAKTRVVRKSKKKLLRAKTKAKTKTKPKTAKRRKPAVRAAKPAAKRAAKPAPARAITRLPDIDVRTTSGGSLRLSSLTGRNVVLYFYPKDDTPGCTVEGCDIRDRYEQFQRTDTVVLGVSRDSLDSHERFKSKFGFPFELVSDPDERLCRAFDVIRKKSLYGKEYMGVDRSTFVFDKLGKLRREFRSVKVDGHAEELLTVLNSF